jgi:hypothetical protein
MAKTFAVNILKHPTFDVTIEKGTMSTGGGGGSGDVVGPSSATDNAVTRFDTTTGKLIQNSLVTIDDSGNVNIPSGTTYRINGTALAKGDVGLGNVDNTSDANKPISSATQTALDGKVDENAAITGATKTKITYDAKGLVTSGADATTADVADSTNRRYVTDAQLTVIGNTSGTNTGDQNLSGYVEKSGSLTQITTRSHTDLSSIGTNTHAQIDTAISNSTSHISNTSNPHSTTASQVGLGNVTNDSQLKRSANDFNSFTNKATPVSGDVILIEDSAASGAKKYITVGSLPTGGGGEANTASNVGTQGVGFYNSKVGIDLQFKNIEAASSKITVTDYPTNKTVRIDASISKSDVGLSNVPNTDCTTTSNITDATNKRFVTDAQLTVIGNTSGTNTGDETQSTIKTKLGAATASVDGYATSTQITKLDGIAAGAEVNVNADWNASSGDAQILNKPSTFAPASHNNTAHSETYITSVGVTYTNLNTNGSVGTGAAQVAAGNHNHSGTYEPVLNADQKRKITISSSDPSGGSDGDVWLKYTP